MTGKQLLLTTGGAGSLRVAFGVMSNNITTISTSGQIFPFTTTRLYIPFYDISNQSQIISKPVKKVNFLDCYAQYFKIARWYWPTE
jgi:CRISPR/Cas system CSM-associated protein Csm4 (group 5 of RAMP superfamily)